MTNPTGMAVQRIECECGFVIEAVDPEVVDTARCHSREVHGIELTADFVRALAHPVPDRRPRRRRK
jgi:predicted small metal-binding protein